MTEVKSVYERCHHGQLLSDGCLICREEQLAVAEDRIAWLERTLECAQEAARTRKHINEHLCSDYSRLFVDKVKLDARVVDLENTLRAVQDYLRTGKWKLPDGIDNVISAALREK